MSYQPIKEKLPLRILVLGVSSFQGRIGVFAGLLPAIPLTSQERLLSEPSRVFTRTLYSQQGSLSRLADMEDPGLGGARRASNLRIQSPPEKTKPLSCSCS